jgi:hypothetical protein
VYQKCSSQKGGVAEVVDHLLCKCEAPPKKKKKKEGEKNASVKIL